MILASLLRRWLGLRPKGIDFCWPGAQIRTENIGTRRNMLGIPALGQYWRQRQINALQQQSAADLQMRAMQDAARERAENQAELDKLFPAGR